MFGQRGTGFEAILQRPHPSRWQLFWQNPCIFLARAVYSWRRFTTPPEIPENAVSIICELEAAISWLKPQPHAVKVVIAGNHDLLLDPGRDDHGGKAAAERMQIDWGNIIYLQDSTAVISRNGRRISIYGSPKSPRHGNWAFQYARQDNVWRGSIPDNTDILITHGPPRAHLDLTTLGCQHLLRELWRVHPTLHVFGHVHEGYGHEWVQFDALQDAYGRIILAGGGIWNLVGLLKAFIFSLFHPPAKATCQLVNSSVVGGLRDDVRRNPIKVYI
ncbi:Metallo-dependent phosphatase [Camillea tinctor]|nr:Metallo-dependent phosphatase [Camillea tinctor]